jgi:hypothetical protein
VSDLMVLSTWNTPRLALYGGAAGTLYAAYDLAGHWSLDPNAMAYCLGGIRELTKVGEREIHEVVLSCTRARRQLLNSVPSITGMRTAAPARIAYPGACRNSWRRPFFCPMVFQPADGSSGCSGCVSDQCVGTVRNLSF